MKQYLSGLVLIGSLIAASCNASHDLARERQTLLETDRAFASAAAAGNLDQVFTYWTDDATIYPAGLPVVRGKTAVREFIDTNRAQPGFSIKWDPNEAVVSQDASLGYTVGDYEVSIEGPDGSAIVRHGRYLQAWRKDDNDAWKCNLEIQSPLVAAGGPDVRPAQEKP